MPQSPTISFQGPRHVAIIMDGNGRWARGHGVPKIEGHRAGAEAVRRVVEVCSEEKIEFLTLYAFSTENWRRPKHEVQQLMSLLRQFLDTTRKDFAEHQVRLNVIGDIEQLPGGVRKRLNEVLKETRNHTGGTVTLALSYGARNEIVRAARRLAEDAVAGMLSPEAITEEEVAKRLYTSDLPDPDLIIRTSGEKRLSNFLLWQASYTELWFTDTLWPDFAADDFRAALREFDRRQRRYGGRQ